MYWSKQSQLRSGNEDECLNYYFPTEPKNISNGTGEQKLLDYNCTQNELINQLTGQTDDELTKIEWFAERCERLKKLGYLKYYNGPQ